ncbi:beta-1,3-galactosyltransferase 5-like [Daphnia pulex]|uniref:beta-1,3-galactosyltransferase 5-like n=1 Tax=Daphnia pulex TaxID=6669 RepID=UPI001EE0A39C|nr:beta-1,3-galactosyltransferase 5-like [Daphnia pulex]
MYRWQISVVFPNMLRSKFHVYKIGFWILEITVTLFTIYFLVNKLKNVNYHRLQQDLKITIKERPFYLGLTSLKEENLGPINGNVTINREFFNFLSLNLHETSYPGAENYTRYTVARLGLSPLVDVQPLIPELGPVINDVLSFRYLFTVSPCVFNDGSLNKKVFVAVNSATHKFGEREMIRQTWLKHLKNEIELGPIGIAGYGFFLGLTHDSETQRTIEKESMQYGDIIQIGIYDFYRNLMLKKAGSFNWLHTNCIEVDYVLMIDDDVYVNVRKLANFVQSYNQSRIPTMFGSPPPPSGFGYFVTLREGKSEIPYEEWPWTHYPPYFNGPAVLITGSAILPLLACFQTTPMLLRAIDDVYNSGICPEKTGIKIHFSNDTLNFYNKEPPIGCELRHVLAWNVLKPENFNKSHFETIDFYQRTHNTSNGLLLTHCN